MLSSSSMLARSFRKRGCLSRASSARTMHHGTTAAGIPSESSSHAGSRAEAKTNLLRLIGDTGRGFRATVHSRGAIEEAQLEVEAYAGPGLDYDLLQGRWKLLFTTATDVIPILEAESRLMPLIGPSPVQVGEIYQRFSNVEEGIVENIIQLSTPWLLRPRDGFTVTVKARYEVRSPHRIALTFEEASVGEVKISDGLEALIAPALLPRGQFSLQLLIAIKEFKLRFPFSSARQFAMRAVGETSPVTAGGNYQLTYCDEDMLIGRATSLGGSFIFSRS